LSSSSVSSWVRVPRSLVLRVCFVGRWLSFFCWPLCCLSLDLPILITPLVYSNSSYGKISYVEEKTIPIRHIYNCLISNLDTGTLIKCDEVKRNDNYSCEKIRILHILKRNDNYSCEKIRNLHMLVKNVLSSRELTNPMFFRWGHITDVIIKLNLQVTFRIDTHYYNTTYNTTYSDGSCGRFWNVFSLTNDIGFFRNTLKYSFTLESSNIVL
jgi:hypothetical protein